MSAQSLSLETGSGRDRRVKSPLWEDEDKKMSESVCLSDWCRGREREWKREWERERSANERGGEKDGHLQISSLCISEMLMINLFFLKFFCSLLTPSPSLPPDFCRWVWVRSRCIRPTHLSVPVLKMSQQGKLRLTERWLNAGGGGGLPYGGGAAVWSPAFLHMGSRTLWSFLWVSSRSAFQLALITTSPTLTAAQSQSSPVLSVLICISVMWSC